MARTWYTVDVFGQPIADIDKVVKEETVYIAGCDGLKIPCSSMTYCPQ